MLEPSQLSTVHFRQSQYHFRFLPKRRLPPQRQLLTLAVFNARFYDFSFCFRSVGERECYTHPFNKWPERFFGLGLLNWATRFGTITSMRRAPSKDQRSEREQLLFIANSLAQVLNQLNQQRPDDR